MNKHQFRALKNTLKRESYYGDSYGFCLPFTRKKITEIQINGKVLNFQKQVTHLYRLTKKNSTHDLFSVHFEHVSSSLYIITKNDKVIYWTTSNIFAPASAAFHVLTEVYHGYRDKEPIWQWKSVENFDCCHMMLIETTRKTWDEPWYKVHHSDYQNAMFAKHALSFIDKRIITQEEADELANKEYHHT